MDRTARRGLRAAAALLLAFAVAHTRFEVEGASMLPALHPGDRLLVRRWPRRAGHGAVVVVADPRAPARLVVKRVSGVHAGAVTVLGDNPAASTDSRSFGPVPVAALRGRVIYRYAPPGRIGRVAQRSPLSWTARSMGARVDLDDTEAVQRLLDGEK